MVYHGSPPVSQQFTTSTRTTTTYPALLEDSRFTAAMLGAEASGRGGAGCAGDSGKLTEAWRPGDAPGQLGHGW